MSELNELLKGLQVKSIPLGEVSIIKRGKRVTKRQLSPEKKYPVYSGGVKPMGYFEDYNQDENTITVVKYGTAGFVNYITEKFWANDVCYCLKPKENLNNKYLLHVLKQKQNHIYSLATDAIPAHLPTDEINGIKIPIPYPDNPEKSLKIQKEIVSILDTFTELTTELTTALTTELTARKKQYEYYREQLLTFEDTEVEWKTLGEVILKTSNIKWFDTNKTYRYIDLSSVCRDKNVITETTEIRKENAPSRAKKIVLKGDVIFATTRPTQLRLCLITEEYSEEIASTGYCVLRANKKVVLPKWIYFWLTSNKFKIYAEDNQSGAAYPAISDSKVKDFSIPVPSPEEQQRIVNILDKFDVLTTSISEGLPKEIDLRKKQYEYYREMLLTFPKPE